MLNQAKVELQDKVKKPQLIHIDFLVCLSKPLVYML